MKTRIYGENLPRVTEGSIAGNLLQSFSTATMKARSRSVFFDDIKKGRCRNDCCWSVTSRWSHNREIRLQKQGSKPRLKLNIKQNFTNLICILLWLDSALCRHTFHLWKSYTDLINDMHYTGNIKLWVYDQVELVWHRVENVCDLLAKAY